MPLATEQTELFNYLRLSVQTSQSRRFVYSSEWLGYLPFGLYHWLEVNGQDISPSFHSEWGRSDLDTLALISHYPT